MDKNFVDLIIKKRDNNPLSTEEINYFIQCVTEKTVPDYQVASMLMAIFLNGVTDKETADLTMAMVKSGEQLDLSSIQGIKVDKHSTGGVGDTTTLIIAPLVASCGLPIIKMSGRGLGHTGGTIDKLESIPNFNTEISSEEAIEIAKKNNIVLISQTKNLTPADKSLYAMRDVTGTVESIPLIASSVMSKKIASGCDAFVLDVKCGDGAFMKNFEDSEKLAQAMVNIGEMVNKKVIAVITDMNQPLGKNIGNSFEVIEAIEVLKGNISGRLKDVSIELGSYMLVLGGICKDKNDAKKLLQQKLENGEGLAKLREFISNQGGNPDVIDDYSIFPIAKYKKQFISNKSGYITNIKTYEVGKIASALGAGRKTKQDKIDYGAGIIFKHLLGEKVSEGDVLLEVYSSSEEKCFDALNMLNDVISISDEPITEIKTILKVIGG